MRLLKVVGLSAWQGGAPCGIAGFGGE